MATIIPSGGVNEREPTTISDEALQDCTGAEYRVGEMGVFVARGRDLYGTISGQSGTGLYEAGFDGTSQYVIAHTGNTYYYGQVAATLTLTAFDSLTSGSSAIVGCHYANRHYTANGVQNRRFEATATGVTSFPVGMSVSTYTIGVSVTQGAGSMTAATGVEYWATEYDSARGIESIYGTTAHTGAFTSKDSIIVTVTGTSANQRADQLRWYRSVDGGGYPDGGLIRTTAIGTTQITDTDTALSTLTVPSYGIISIGGLDTERDEAPDAMSVIFGPFQDSLMGVAVAEPRVLRFTPSGYPDSWPSGYGIPLETERRDEIVTGVVLENPARVAVFCLDSVHVVTRLARDSDSIFAAGEASSVVTKARGCVSRRGACTFTPPGGGALVAWVARDGIWAGNMASAPLPVTDRVDWDGRVSITNLSTCRLTDDPQNRRLVFIHRRAADTTHNTGLWYIDYQEMGTRGLRVTFADHGPLADAITVAATTGKRQVVSLDSRSGNGQVYLESTQDVDDSQLVSAAGAVVFRARTKELMPAGPRGTAQMNHATFMHDAGPATVLHRYYFDRRDSNPEVKTISNWNTRNASEVYLGRSVNSMSVEIESVGTVSYGIHWIDVESDTPEPLAGRKGA